MKRRNPQSIKHRMQDEVGANLNVTDWGKMARPAQIKAAAKIVIDRFAKANKED